MQHDLDYILNYQSNHNLFGLRAVWDDEGDILICRLQDTAPHTVDALINVMIEILDHWMPHRPFLMAFHLEEHQLELTTDLQARLRDIAALMTARRIQGQVAFVAPAGALHSVFPKFIGDTFASYATQFRIQYFTRERAALSWLRLTRH